MDLTRIDPPNNVHRFYRMEIMPGLFGEWSLIREWGRIGQSGQVRVDWYDTEAAAKDTRFDILMNKSRRGYE
jgi:predicted DNA-binding WGR domain protein